MTADAVATRSELDERIKLEIEARNSYDEQDTSLGALCDAIDARDLHVFARLSSLERQGVASVDESGQWSLGGDAEW